MYGGDMIVFKKLFVLGIVFCLLAPNTSLADNRQYDPYPFQFKQGKFYASLNAGATFLNDIEAGPITGFAGTTSTANGKFTFDTGWSLGGTIGYIFNDLIRGEFNLGYTEMDHDTAEGTLTFASGGNNLAVAGSADIKGQVDAIYGMTNVILTPLGNTSVGGGKLTPLIGGGIGFVAWEDSVDSITFGATTLQVGGKETATDFASNLIAGLEYSQKENLLIGIRYRHSWIDSGTGGVDDSEADQVSGTLTYRF